MNNITIICIIVVIVVMSESGRSEQAENGSFQNQTEGPVSCGLLRRASKEVLPLWEGLKQRSAPRGNPRAAGLKRQSLNRARKVNLTSRIRRTASDFSVIANKELESLA